MKLELSLIVLFVFGWMDILPAQDLNLGLEEWETSEGLLCVYEEPLGPWLSINLLCNFGGPETVMKTDDAAEGNFAAFLESKLFTGIIEDSIPGILFTGELSALFEPIIGIPYQFESKPVRFKGMYKYQPAADDSCALFFQATKWNNTTNQRDTIAEIAFAQNDFVFEYTEFDLEIEYFSTEEPDSFGIVLGSSGDPDGGAVPGSKLWIDALELVLENEVSIPLFECDQIKSFPNPTTDRINIQSDFGGVLSLFNLDGKECLSATLNAGNNQIDLSSFETGTYIYTVKSSGLCSGNQSGKIQIIR